MDLKIAFIAAILSGATVGTAASTAYIFLNNSEQSESPSTSLKIP